MINICIKQIFSFYLLINTINIYLLTQNILNINISYYIFLFTKRQYCGMNPAP